MKITFIGVGEAFDENYPNTSHLLTTKETNMMVDCGYSVPRTWWRMGYDTNFLDAIYISHLHGDHFFGLPIILTRMTEEGRTKPLTIISHAKAIKVLKIIQNIAYKGFSRYLKFPIHFVVAKPGKNIIFRDLLLSFAPTIHSIENLALKVTCEEKTYCYSGDGQFVKETEELYKNADLVIQETYLYDEKRSGHTCVTDGIAMAERLGVKRLALTHLNRYFRKNELPTLRDKITSQKTTILIPEPGDVIEL